nr:hypothetical protein CFP56_00493 [Quercus suber]
MPGMAPTLATYLGGTGTSVGRSFAALILFTSHDRTLSASHLSNTAPKPTARLVAVRRHRVQHQLASLVKLLTLPTIVTLQAFQEPDNTMAPCAIDFESHKDLIVTVMEKGAIYQEVLEGAREAWRAAICLDTEAKAQPLVCSLQAVMYLGHSNASCYDHASLKFSASRPR